MRKNNFNIILFLISIFLFMSTVTIYSKDKDKDDKDKKDKKEKDEKIKDKDILVDDFVINIIKSDIIYSENEKFINNIENINKEKNKINKIISLYKLLEELLGESDNIKRDIKISTPGKSAENIRQKYLYTKNNLDFIIKEGDNVLDTFNNEEKNLTTQQIGAINKSNKILTKTLSIIDNDLNKVADNEDIFNKMKIVEKEMQVLYRQYRAIEWLFVEK